MGRYRLIAQLLILMLVTAKANLSPYRRPPFYHLPSAHLNERLRQFSTDRPIFAESI
jgi:hypothetical protein